MGETRRSKHQELGANRPRNSGGKSAPLWPFMCRGGRPSGEAMGRPGGRHRAPIGTGRGQRDGVGQLVDVPRLVTQSLLWSIASLTIEPTPPRTATRTAAIAATRRAYSRVE